MVAELSVVLPCFNEAGNIPNIIARYRALRADFDFELILVDNGSTDETSVVIGRELKKNENSFIRMHRIPKNLGYGHGLNSGLSEARADVVAFSHADLQCPPEDLKTAFTIFNERSRFCLVKGKRRGSRPWPDQVVTWFYNRLAFLVLKIHGQNNRVLDVNAEPKLFPRSLLADLKNAPLDFTFDLFVLTAAAKRALPIVEFDVKYEARVWGKSKLAANPWVRLKTSLRAFKKILELSR